MGWGPDTNGGRRRRTREKSVLREGAGKVMGMGVRVGARGDALGEASGKRLKRENKS